MVQFATLNIEIIVNCKEKFLLMSITKNDIEKLFEELWPAMRYAHNHKQNCLHQFNAIDNYFKKSRNHNLLLKNLSSLDGIGITIGTGLIWSVFPYSRVPFDRYTLTFAIDAKIIRTNKITENYVAYSENIKKFCDGFLINNRPYIIEDFVREAMEKFEGSEFLINPE